MKLSRTKIIDHLIKTLNPYTYIYAIWESGAIAFNRVDNYSDIDLSVQVAEDKIEDVIKLFEKKLTQLAPLESKYRLPDPTWHGNAQVFYKIGNTPKHLIIDVTFLVRDSVMRFLEKERHGNAKMYFDKLGGADKTKLNKTRHKERVKKHFRYIAGTFPFFSILAEKELTRGKNVEAIMNYNAFLIKPLTDLLRIKHKPERFDFGPKSLEFDIPADEIQKLNSLCYVAGPEDLSAKIESAKKWIKKEIDELNKKKIG